MPDYRRILVVEDDRAISRGLEFGLKQEGFEVTLAETGHSLMAERPGEVLDALRPFL